VDVNEKRPSRATRVFRKERLEAERARMKPVAVAPAEYGLRYAVQVGATALVKLSGDSLRHASIVRRGKLCLRTERVTRVCAR
jgi:hypothetical protein